MKKRWAGALLSVKCCCFVRKTSWKCHSFEKKKKERKKNILVVWRLSGLVLLWCLFTPLGMLFLMKALEDEWYIAVKAYSLPFLRVWEIMCIIIYCVSALSLCIKSTEIAYFCLRKEIKWVINCMILILIMPFANRFIFLVRMHASWFCVKTLRMGWVN